MQGKNSVIKAIDWLTFFQWGQYKYVLWYWQIPHACLCAKALSCVETDWGLLKEKHNCILFLITSHFECKFYSICSNIFRYHQGSVLSVLQEQFLLFETNKQKTQRKKWKGRGEIINWMADFSLHEEVLGKA